MTELNIMDTELAELNSKLNAIQAQFQAQMETVKAQISKIEIEKAEKRKIFLFKRETLDGMTRRQLQKLAKDHSLNSNAKSETIKRNLLLIVADRF